MRTIVISDIHGHYDEFRKLLQLVNFKITQDKLFLLGDYVDKGQKSKELIQYIMELSKHKNIKIIGGNHDDMFLSWLDNNEHRLFPYNSAKNAGTTTILSFAPFFIQGKNDNKVRAYIKENFKEEILFLRNLPNYIEDEEHIYVHAGVDFSEEDWKNTTHKNFRWIRKKFYDKKNFHNKTIIFGHTVTAKIRNSESNFNIWFGEKMIGIDGGSKFGGQLNALVIENNKYSCYSVKTPQYERIE